MFNKFITIILLSALSITASFGFVVPKESISFKIGNGAKQMYIAANPQCKYTKIFFDEAKETLKDYTVNIFLLKREHLKKSYAMIDYILLAKSNEERVKRFNDIIFNNSKEYEKLPDFKEFIRKSKIAAELEYQYEEEKDEKHCMNAFMIKKEIEKLDANYKFDKSNIDELKITDKALKSLDATNSPTIFDVEFHLMDWMRLVKSKEQFRARCVGN